MKKAKTDEKRIEAKFDYDYLEDIFYSKIKNREYKESIIFEDFIFDIDNKEKVVGLEILNYSKLLGISKYYLSHIKQMKFEVEVDKKYIRLTFLVIVDFRNKLRERKIDFERVNEWNIQPSKIEAPLTR